MIRPEDLESTTGVPRSRWIDGLQRWEPRNNMAPGHFAPVMTLRGGGRRRGGGGEGVGGGGGGGGARGQHAGQLHGAEAAGRGGMQHEVARMRDEGSLEATHADRGCITGSVSSIYDGSGAGSGLLPTSDVADDGKGGDNLVGPMEASGRSGVLGNEPLGSNPANGSRDHHEPVTELHAMK